MILDDDKNIIYETPRLPLTINSLIELGAVVETSLTIRPSQRSTVIWKYNYNDHKCIFFTSYPDDLTVDNELEAWLDARPDENTEKAYTVAQLWNLLDKNIETFKPLTQ